MIESTGTPGAAPLRAQLDVGGVTLAHYQLGIALALGCERVICVAQALDADLLALQQQAQGSGARFHVVPGPRGMLGLVAAQDELIGLADGLLASPEVAVGLLGGGAAVVVQPIEQGLVAGFERLDLNHAAAGAWTIPGRLVERLSEMPPDCDAFGTLQRIALQAGVAQKPLPAEAGSWVLLRSEAEAHAAEAAWIRLQTEIDGHSAPALRLAQAAVRRLGPALLHAGSGRVAVASGGLALLLLALVAGWFALPLLGLLLAGLAWPVLIAAVLIGRVERQALRVPAPRLVRGPIYAALVDITLVLLLVWGVPIDAGTNLLWRGFAPLMLLGLARVLAQLAPQSIGAAWARLLADRAILALLLAVAAGFGALGPATALLALALLAAALALIHQG
jgi:hypothetical protein